MRGVIQFALMLQLEEALERILGTVPGLSPERISLVEAEGRFAAERVIAPIDLPPFDNSSMDGYAVRAADTSGATRQNEVRLQMIGRVPAGSSFAQKVGAGQCVRVFTGSLVPCGANAVVMQEDTKQAPGEPEMIEVLTGVPPGENLRRRGEDVAKGSVVLEEGAQVTAGRISLLAALGVQHLTVGRRPVVGVLATGSELREPGQNLAPGQIYESNRLALSILIRQAGGEARVFPLVRDSLEETRFALSQARETCDLLVTSGGVSVGEMDFVKSAFEENGGKLEFWKVAVKPGRPFVYGRTGRKLLFGLPGNPVSTFVTFLLLVRPVLLRWQGARDLSLPCSSGVLAEPLINEGARRHFFRVRIDADGRVRSTGLQASHALSSLAEANGLVDVPAKGRLEAGESVRVLNVNT
jgi:molybdopterin molybdotransferase